MTTTVDVKIDGHALCVEYEMVSEDIDEVNHEGNHIQRSIKVPEIISINNLPVRWYCNDFTHTLNQLI